MRYFFQSYLSMNLKASSALIAVPTLWNPSEKILLPFFISNSLCKSSTLRFLSSRALSFHVSSFMITVSTLLENLRLCIVVYEQSSHKSSVYICPLEEFHVYALFRNIPACPQICLCHTMRTLLHRTVICTTGLNLIYVCLVYQITCLVVYYTASFLHHAKLMLSSLRMPRRVLRLLRYRSCFSMASGCTCDHGKRRWLVPSAAFRYPAPQYMFF